MKHSDPLAKVISHHIRQRELTEMADVLSTKSGRMFVWRILEKAGVFRGSMDGNMSWTAFKEGARSIGLQVYVDIMDSCPGRLTEMWQEAKIQRQEDEAYGRTGNTD